MIAPRGTSIVELDRHATEANQPYGIITADCSSPKEIDDGIFVEELPSHEETYRVGVCVADTSKLYDDPQVLKQAMRSTEAKYYNLTGNEQGYEPMIDPELIRGLEFSEGNVRSSLMVQFVVGATQPPSDVTVSFGRVEVTRNHDYREFGWRCRQQETYQKFGRASAFILSHLRFTSGGDEDRGAAIDTSAHPDAVHHQLVNMPAQQAWLRGSRLNEAYMVAANNLVGKMMADEGRPAIYRVHDPEDETHLEFLPPNVATYSQVPGPHIGLNLLDGYCRVTSPLRRLEDFMMSHLLKVRDLRLAPTRRDRREVGMAVQRLNGRVMQEVFQGPLRVSDYEVLGNAGRRPANPAYGNGNVVPIHKVVSGAATA